MYHTNFNTVQPLYCPSASTMVDVSDVHYLQDDLSETLILGRLRRNVVVNIPSIPTLAQ